MDRHGVVKTFNAAAEKMLGYHAAEVIEKVVWQIVPEIATRIIEREIERLLRERDKK